MFSKYFAKYYLTFVLIFHASQTHAKSIEIVSDQDVWIPDLRGIPLGRTGEIVAEFSVASAPSATSKEEDNLNKEEDKIVRPNKEYNICTDPDSKIILYPKNEEEKSLPLTTAVEQFGRFEDTELAQDDMHKTQSSQEQNASKVEFKSVLITGKCCWEAFSRPFYNGKKLRMCRGKYTARDLGSHSSNIASIRPVNHIG